MRPFTKTTQFLSIAALSLGLILLSAPAQAQTDPPGRVARVSFAYGNIDFADAGSNQWAPLLANRPLSTGDSIFVAEHGRAELHVGANALRLGEKSRLSFIQLTDDHTQLQLAQGSMFIRVRNLPSREVFEVTTPNLRFAIQEAGEYRINVNEDNTTSITVRRGLGVAQGERDVITLRSGEQTRFSGINLYHTQIAAIDEPDTLDQWAYDRDRAEDNSRAARYVSREVIGYEQLDEYGYWETHAEYGPIWYPRGISVGWAPYRDGKWVWVAPWGWTWVDRAPWGFAPYHYGRWASVSGRWCWVPGRYQHDYRPVYAPALVAFIGVGTGGLNAGISISSGGHFSTSISWFPLGPRELYRPYYSHNPHYIQNVNQTVINRTTINNVNIVNNNQVYVNQHVQNAVTTVPTQTFVRGEHVFPVATNLRSQEIRSLRVLDEGPNLTPDRLNRFGDARPRNWEENEQFHNRPTVTAAVRNEGLNAGITPNNFNRTPNNNPNNNHVIEQTPSAAGNTVNLPNSRHIESFDRAPTQMTRPIATGTNNATPNPDAGLQRNTGIRTVEEMNAERNTMQSNTDRREAVKQFPQVRPDDINRGAFNNPRFETRRDIDTRPNPSAAMAVPRPIEHSYEQANVRPMQNQDRGMQTVERPVNNFERSNERQVERNNDKAERRMDHGIERSIERPAAAMPAMPTMQMPRQEPVRVAPAEPKQATPVRAEKEKGSDKWKDNR